MTFRGTLHPYQREPVERFLHRGSLLLAYAPGTGKTVIAIAAIEKLLEEEEINFALIICPASLKYQWLDKVREFTDTTVVVIDGSKQERARQYKSVREIGNPYATYIIISYDLVIFDHDELSQLSPGMVVCDEASALKSFRTQRSKRVKKLFGQVPYRMALTATPIENRPEELYSIMQWVDSSVLGRYDLFEKAYISRHKRGWVSAYKNLDALRIRLGESIARKGRHDPEVRRYLPDVDENNWEVELTRPVIRLYKDIADDMLHELSKLDKFSDFDLNKYYRGIDESTPPGKLMAMHMCIEMLLDHPDLIIWSGMEYEKDSPYGSAYANYLWQSGAIDNLTDSPKLRKLKQHVDDILDFDGSKMIIFSKYKYMLNIIADTLEYKSVQFTGDMSAKFRAGQIYAFASDPDCRLFISSHAGGYGIDMPMADYLVNYDLPASFGAQDQLNSRHVRASSEFPKVYVRNMITSGTLEERNLRRLDRKRRISDLAIDGAAPDKLHGTSVALDADYLRTHLEYFRSNY